jgi:hypothetical protein
MAAGGDWIGWVFGGICDTGSSDGGARDRDGYSTGMGAVCVLWSMVH